MSTYTKPSLLMSSKDTMKISSLLLHPVLPYLFVHDVLSKKLIIMSSVDLSIVQSYKGYGISLFFQEDTVFVGTDCNTVVCYLGKKCLGILDVCKMMQTTSKGPAPIFGSISDGVPNFAKGAGHPSSDHQAFKVVTNFTENMVIRKMVGCKHSRKIVTLEVVDADDKNATEISCFDLDIQRVVFSKKLVEEEESLAAKEVGRQSRYTKSIELSADDKSLFTVGVVVDADSEGKPTQKGFITALKFNATFSEQATLLLTEMSHPDKRGLYRITALPQPSSDPNGSTLLVGGWTDIFMVSYTPPSQSVPSCPGVFTLLRSFTSIHNSLVFNIQPSPSGGGFYSCSHDCETNYTLI
jgi:hypothetical protein